MADSPPRSQIIEENDCFYFESDHLALKGNKEYSELLKTIFILESQRQRVIKDYEEVVKIKKKLLDDPLSMVEKLKKGESLNVPDLFHVPEVPKINWSKYNVQIPEKFFTQISSDKFEEGDKIKRENLFKNMNGSNKKKSWTVEEQKRLEELLIIYPPEEIELRRFKKIAKALGNRTVQQVTSRLQKYFIKLYKAGLPIPGRIPKSVDKKKAHKHQRHNHYLLKPSTFFPHLNIPVAMDDSDESPGPSQGSRTGESAHAPSPTNYLLPGTYPDENNKSQPKSDVEIQLGILRKVKNEKLKIENGETLLFQHDGYSCDYCNEEPITGSRWHCTTCVSDSIDFCSDCLVAQMYSENSHPLAHDFVIFRNDKISTSGSTSGDSSEESDTEGTPNNDESCSGYSDAESVETTIRSNAAAPTEISYIQEEEEQIQPSTSHETTTLVNDVELTVATNDSTRFSSTTVDFSDVVNMKCSSKARNVKVTNSNYDEIFTHTQNFSDFLDTNLLFDE